METVADITAERAAALVGTSTDLLVPAMGKSDQDPLLVKVDIIQVRVAFGRVDLMVSPDSGSGEMWVQLDRTTATLPEVPKP